MITKMSGASKQLTERDIARAERELGRQIPPAYRQFLLKYNGGHPTPSDFKMAGIRKGATEVGSVKSFLGIDTPVDTLNLNYVIETFQGRIPASFFPIARDPGGNLIGIGGLGSQSDKVYFWDHEREAEEGEQPADTNMHLISETFEEFINGLREV
jgi:hypothetical protein